MHERRSLTRHEVMVRVIVIIDVCDRNERLVLERLLFTVEVSERALTTNVDDGPGRSPRAQVVRLTMVCARNFVCSASYAMDVCW